MEHEAFSAAFTGVTKLFLIVETNLLLVTFQNTWPENQVERLGFKIS